MTSDEKRGQFLAQLRKDKGLTQQELGKMLHYTDKAISKWEQGKAIPNLEVLKKLSEIFDVKVLELMYGENENNENKCKIEDNIVEELTSSHHKYRRNIIIVVITFLISIIVGLVLIYYFFIRNSIVVYSIGGESENFVIKNGALVLSNKISLFNFNKVESKNNEKIKYIRVYYLDKKGNANLVFEGSNEDYFLEETNGYQDYNFISIEKNDTYVEVIFDNDEKEIVKLNLQKRYINDNIFPEKDGKVSEQLNKNKQDSESVGEKLISMGFKYENSDYVYEINNGTICYVNSNTLSINILSYGKRLNYFIHSYFDDDEILVEKQNDKNEVLDSQIIIQDEEKDCINKACTIEEDYTKFITFLKKKMS